MRIVFLRATHIDPDPRVEKEVESLIDAGHECVLVGWDRSSTHEPQMWLYEIGGHPVEKTLFGVESAFGSGAKNASRMMRFEHGLFGWLVSNAASYDCVHACDLDTGYVARLASRRTGKPYVYDMFDFFADSRNMPSWMRGVFAQAERRVVDGAYATIICTEQRSAQLAGMHPQKLIVIENTPKDVYGEADIPVPMKRGGCVRIAYVGVLTGDRFIDRVLASVAAYDDLSLVIGGFGPLEGIVRDAARCGRVGFLGKISYAEALSTEAAADVMLGLYDPRVPNNRLAAPNKYYESLMLGTPLLAVEGTSVGDWVASEGTGIALAEGFNEGDFHDAVLRLADANADGSITRVQRRLYEREHSWSVMASRLQDLYGRMGTDLGVDVS